MRRNQFRCIIVILIFLFVSSVLIFFSVSQFENGIKSSAALSASNTFLLVVIASAGQNREKRDVIRSTWLTVTQSSAKSKHIFVVGDKDTSYDKDELQTEARLNGDILLLHNISDAYDSLTIKVLEAFARLSEKGNFRYLLKCDDDSYLRLEQIVHELETRFHDVNNLYWGFFHGSANVKRRGKWKETKWILCDHYLPYALGGGYVLSQSLVNFIARNKRDLVIFQPEDVSVGTWLAPVNVTRIHDPRFDTEYISRGCSNSYLITHKHDLFAMRHFHANLLSNGNLCETEFKLRLSYLYNWDVEPSKCCIRSNSSIP